MSFKGRAFSRKEPTSPLNLLIAEGEHLERFEDRRFPGCDFTVARGACHFHEPGLLAKGRRAPHCLPMRNLHVWKTKTEEGEKREVRAVKFGKRWRLQAKAKNEENWTYYDDEPLMSDLLELRDVLFRKYQRKHLSYEDLEAVEKMITDRGGMWETAE
jgi:hypothetical protein